MKLAGSTSQSMPRAVELNLKQDLDYTIFKAGG